MIAVRLGMIKAQRIKEAHLEMKEVGQGMNALKEALLGMIRTSDLPMTQNQWLSNTTPDSTEMCNNGFKDDQNADNHEDECVVLANLIETLKLNIYENKKTQKQLSNANTTLTHELKECKSTLEETNRIIRESNRTQDRYLVALHDKEDMPTLLTLRKLLISRDVEDKMFPLDEPYEEIGSEAFELPALKDEEFAQIVVLGLCVSFPNGEALSFVLNSPKHVSFQSPKESVGSNDMVHNYYLEKAKKKAQLYKDKYLNPKPSVITPARLPNTSNDNKPKPRNSYQQRRNWPPSMSSQRYENLPLR
nr:hypothetical protein [Tanacetum cinerariifolium]